MPRKAFVQWLSALPRRLARDVRRGVLQLAILAVFGSAVVLWVMGGVTPLMAYWMEPDVALWPLGHAFRRVAVEVTARRGADPTTLMPLMRLAHTLDPANALWDDVVQAAGGLLGVEIDSDDVQGTLARIDTAAARALQRPIAPLGVLGWWDLDPYFVEWLDGLAGDDIPLAIERFNRIGSRDGLPNAEWYLTELGRAFGDQRPIHFVLVADTPGRRWSPVAVAPDNVPEGARRIVADTVGEALIVGLWALMDDRPESPDTDPVAWWTPIADARGLPRATGSQRAAPATTPTGAPGAP